MNDERAFDEALSSWLRQEGTGLRQDLVEDALHRAAATRQRDGVVLAVAGPTSWPRTLQAPWPRALSMRAGLLVALLVVVSVALGFSGGVFIGAIGNAPSPTLTMTPTATPSPTVAPTPSPTPVPTVSATPSPRFSPASEGVTDLAARQRHPIPADQLVTSSTFGMPMTFRVRSHIGKADTEWCWADTSERVIAMAYKYGCTSEVRFLLPSAVDCSVPDSTPDAATFASALLANEGLYAEDWGSVSDRQTLLAGVFSQPVSGRLIRIAASQRFRFQAVDPDCQIRSGSTIDEIRGDRDSLLILLDIDGQLVVIRSGAGPDLDSSFLPLLGDFQEISFGL